MHPISGKGGRAVWFLNSSDVKRLFGLGSRIIWIQNEIGTHKGLRSIKKEKDIEGPQCRSCPPKTEVENVRKKDISSFFPHVQTKKPLKY